MRTARVSVRLAVPPPPKIVPVLTAPHDGSRRNLVTPPANPSDPSVAAPWLSSSSLRRWRREGPRRDENDKGNWGGACGHDGEDDALS